MPKDYVQAYLDALAQEHRLADREKQKQLEARLREACAALEKPYREAIRLRGESDALRGAITLGVQDGLPESELLAMALRCIAGLCGDQAFATYNLAALAAQKAGAPPPKTAEEAEALTRRARRQEYNHLLARVASVMDFAGNPAVPEEDRARALSTLGDIQARMLTVLAELGEYTADEAASGFAEDG